MKTSENRRFPDVFRGCRFGTFVKNGLIRLNEGFALYVISLLMKNSIYISVKKEGLSVTFWPPSKR